MHCYLPGFFATHQFLRQLVVQIHDVDSEGSGVPEPSTELQKECFLKFRNSLQAHDDETVNACLGRLRL